MKKLKKLLEMNCMMKVFKSFFVLSLAISVHAQESETTRPAQITLITPMGTNGMEAPRITNIFSLNIIAGYSGGVKGLEVGGFSNVLKGSMQGIQIAGFSNIVNGSASGAQVAGFINLNRSDVSGVQIAGFTNIVAKEVNAFQLSGFSNYANGNSEKGQVAGFLNVTRGDAGVPQIAGFTNIAKGNLKGIQIAGFLNIVQEKTTGGQIGFLNISKQLKGVQIGFVNVSGEVEEGIPFGFLSFVKNGYKALEVGGNETLHGIVSFKTGVNKFYNILSVGGALNQKNAWATGYGLGTMWPLSEKTDLSVEAVGYQIYEKETWEQEELNMLNRLNINASYGLSEKLALFGGAAWNIAVSDLKSNEGTVEGSVLIPWHSYNKNHNGVNVQMYPGFNLGLRMKL